MSDDALERMAAPEAAPAGHAERAGPMPERMEGHEVVLRRRWAVAATPEAVGAMRREVTAFVRSTEALVPERLQDVRLVVGELVSNVVRHAYGRDGDERRIEVDALVDGHIRLTVRDEGAGMAGDTPRDEGHGLGVVSALAAELRIHSRPGAGTEAVVILETDAPPTP